MSLAPELRLYPLSAFPMPHQRRLSARALVHPGRPVIQARQ